MQIEVKYLDNLKLEAAFDDFRVLTDQPIRYKGDGTAPGPFDYFLASSALCAAYFVKVYCKARSIPTEDIKVTQDNIIDPENRYQQTFNIQIELPASISEKDKKGILESMERCTVKRVIQNGPKFVITAKETLQAETNLGLELNPHQKTVIAGKDSPLEETIEKMSQLIADLGIKLEVASWRNIVPHVWSVHLRDAESPMCYTNGKGATKEAALASALGEFIERISNNYFFNDFYLGKEISDENFVHYPDEKWFKIPADNSIPEGLMDEYLLGTYGNDGDLKGSHLIDTNSGNSERGICALPFTRQSDQEVVFIPVNLIGNLFVSNGMSAGNSLFEARVQALSEIFERAVKNEIIVNEYALPDVPKEILNRYPKIQAGIKALEDKGFPILVKDASLGGKFPVMCITLINPKTGGVFASFGSHPCFEIALERSLTELLQGRSFEGLNEMLPPTFSEYAVKEHNNIIDHFIDSTGVISWRFFSSKEDYSFSDWDFRGSTQEEFNYLMNLLKDMNKEVYIADYHDLGASACRILIPNYSEIYPSEDLIWDNNNQALHFRDDILNLHNLDNAQLNALQSRLAENEMDHFMPISELIGVAFDENSFWGQLCIGELRAHIHILNQDLITAKELIEEIATFDDSTATRERKQFYQLLYILLEIETTEDIEIESYQSNLIKMYGKELYSQCRDIILGHKRFSFLPQTDANLTHQEKHLELIKCYKKLHKKREQTLV
jgi:ribosomal protein S12 methylthiotransferase accessory factor